MHLLIYFPMCASQMAIWKPDDVIGMSSVLKLIMTFYTFLEGSALFHHDDERPAVSQGYTCT